MISIGSIQSKAKLVGKNRKAIQDKFSKIENGLKDACNGISFYGGTSKDIELHSFDHIDIHGCLSFRKGVLSVTYYEINDGERQIVNYVDSQICYEEETKHISKCSDAWLEKLSQKEVLDSLLSSIDRNVQSILETSDASRKTLESTLQSQSTQLAKNHQKALKKIGESRLLEDWNLARDKIESDPSDSVTRSSSYIESVCRKILTEQKEPLPKTITTVSLVKACEKVLKLQYAEAERDIKQIIGGIKGVVGGIGALRTHFGTAHGKSPDDFEIDSHYARLANDSAAAVSLFLLYRHKVKLNT